MLELDFEPFNASFPRPTLNKSIGNGVEFLNRHLSAKLFHDKESMQPLLEFLRLHSYKGKVYTFFFVLFEVYAWDYQLSKLVSIDITYYMNLIHMVLVLPPIFIDNL